MQEFSKKLEDRFGKLPKRINELFDGLRIRWIAKKIGFERIILKKWKVALLLFRQSKIAVL